MICIKLNESNVKLSSNSIIIIIIYIKQTETQIVTHVNLKESRNNVKLNENLNM